jgi:hypothetical protein
MNADASLRRQLRFALFLQIAGAAMFGLACIVRAVSLGVDLATIAFGLVSVLILVAAGVTGQRLRILGR